LNSESSIRYPVAFSGNKREIETTGECYCEIAKDASRPFIVKIGTMRVEVLGTHFNINSYSDEGVIKTTLLEGKVKITEGNSAEVLSPGQQGQLQKQTDKLQVISDIDLEQVVAWKNGYFQFNKDDLQTVMRQIARWYDLDVVYEGTIPRTPFWGELPRSAKASAVLNALEKSGVHFRIEGKKVIVTP
jgi:ferric-dicitrate binding protein FerR (iron transport regulator)